MCSLNANEVPRQEAGLSFSLDFEKDQQRSRLANRPMQNLKSRFEQHAGRFIQGAGRTIRVIGLCTFGRSIKS
jgi:hypothetical protein